MKNTVDPDSCDSIFHKPRGNPRPKDCLKRALELIDYEACLKEQEATRNQDIRIGVGLALGVHGTNCVVFLGHCCPGYAAARCKGFPCEILNTR